MHEKQIQADEYPHSLLIHIIIYNNIVPAK